MSSTTSNGLPESHENGSVIPEKSKQNGEDKKLKNRRKKKKKKNRRTTNENIQIQPTTNNNDENKVEIEYVAANPLDEIDASDPAYEEFARIFGRFNAQQQPEETEEQNKPEEENKSAELNNADEDDEDNEEDKPKLSKKEKKRRNRLSIAVLKQLVKRPDVVEAWDVTSADPALLVYLKAYRNTVPVPRHWNQKRKYLQGKRGIEKPPFALPDFIAATGISKIRAAIEQREDAKSLKSKQRDKMQARVGKMDINYQVLHDAFFRYQTKPKLTIHGDLYYEGKEFEITLKEKRPGHLSDELRRALGMPEGAPPPWIINMQRVGPPPAYPNLKLPGVNAPLPEGARYGYHPGGWGKPPVDELGRPLYGDVFGTAAAAAASDPDALAMQPVERGQWGELQDTELPPDEEEAEEGGEEEEGQPEEGGADGSAPSGWETPSGLETPETVELRKAPATSSSASDEGKALYQVLQQRETAVGTALYGSSHGYIVPAQSERRELKNKSTVDLMRSQAGEKLDIALEPSEVENLEQMNPDILRKKYEQARMDKQPAKEDVSDVLMEGLQKKRKKKDEKDNKSKKYKDFKF